MYSLHKVKNSPEPYNRMSLEKFISDFEGAIEDLEAGSLNAQTNYQSLPVWDSLALLTVISMVDSEYGVSVSAAILNGCDSVASLYEKIIESSK